MTGTAVLSRSSADHGLVSVCCHCQRVRGHSGEWEFQFVPDDRLVSHGICRECYREFYPGYPLPGGEG